MTITLEIGRELEEVLARRAAARGVGIDAYAAGLLAEAAYLPLAPGEPTSSRPSKDVMEAIERLRTFGKTHGLSLRGTTIRELRHEARP